MITSNVPSHFFTPCFVVLASGTGTNFSALAQNFPHQVTGLVCNVQGAPVLKRAQAAAIPALLVPHNAYPNRPSHDRAVVAALAQLNPKVELVVLAGYMRILSPAFFEEIAKKLPGVRLVNLHPAHLSDYKGAHGYAAAVERLAPRWGLSVHEVIPELDAGPLLASLEIPVAPYLTAPELQKFAQPFEHALLVQAVTAVLRAPPVLQEIKKAN